MEPTAYPQANTSKPNAGEEPEAGYLLERTWAWDYGTAPCHFETSKPSRTLSVAISPQTISTLRAEAPGGLASQAHPLTRLTQTARGR